MSATLAYEPQQPEHMTDGGVLFWLVVYEQQLREAHADKNLMDVMFYLDRVLAFRAERERRRLRVAAHERGAEG